jgi:hypothetical protein
MASPPTTSLSISCLFRYSFRAAIADSAEIWEEAGASSRNFLAGGGVAGSMSWEDLFLELFDLRERHLAQVCNAFAVKSGGCFL